VSRQFTHGHLVRGLLKLENLLVHKLTFLMVNDVRIQGAIFTGALVTRLLDSTASPWERQARETAVDADIFTVVTTLAADVHNS
jgi:hypothetical protein